MCRRSTDDDNAANAQYDRDHLICFGDFVDVFFFIYIYTVYMCAGAITEACGRVNLHASILGDDDFFVDLQHDLRGMKSVYAILAVS